MYLIDRRKNPGGKNLANAQRFFERVKADIRAKIDQTIKERKVADNVDDGTVTDKNKITVSSSTIHEPFFHFTHEKGIHIVVLPGNKSHENDRLF